ncbi:hypothetical protein CRENBAI_014405 [Crenichthys baileyi]|uniref:Uncharacterized protein n=1 Tax=Crenichthys baileyi TaxID=28760 RepID=A0AAV9R3V1_9TELE
MFPPTTDPADKRKEDALDRWVQCQKEEAMRNLPTDMEVLPSPLLLEQMEREAVQHRCPPALWSSSEALALLPPQETSAWSTFLWFGWRGGGFPASRCEGCGKPDTPQPDSGPDTPQPVSPQPGMTPDPKSASTSSTCHRGRRERGPSAQFIEGLGDASASAHATEGLCDASASAHATEGLADASAPALVTEGPADASAPAHVTEGPADASTPAPCLQAFQGFSEKLVLVLASEPCDEGFEEEALPDPVSEGFKEQLVFVLVSEPRDEVFEEEAPLDPVPEGFNEQFVLVLASEPRDEGSPGAASASEGSPGSASASEGSPGSQPDYEALVFRPPEFHRVSGGSSTLLGRPPDQPAGSHRRPPQSLWLLSTSTPSPPTAQDSVLQVLAPA